MTVLAVIGAAVTAGVLIYGAAALAADLSIKKPRSKK